MATLADINSALQEQTKVVAKEDSLAENAAGINSLSDRIASFMSKDRANAGDRLEEKAERNRVRSSSRVIRARAPSTTESGGSGLLGNLARSLGPIFTSLAGLTGIAAGTALMDQDVGLPGDVNVSDAAKGLGAAFVTGLVTKNPFIRLGTLLGGMYSDEIGKLIGGEDGKVFGYDVDNAVATSIIGGAAMLIAPMLLRFGAGKAVAAVGAVIAARNVALDTKLGKIADEAADDIAKAAGGTGTRRTPPLTATQRNALGGYDEFKVKTPTLPIDPRLRSGYVAPIEPMLRSPQPMMTNAPRLSSPGQTSDDILKAIAKQIDDLPITRTGPVSLYTPKPAPRPLIATRAPVIPKAKPPTVMSNAPTQPKGPSAADLEAEKIFKKKWVPDWLKSTVKIAGRYVPPAIMAYDGVMAVNDPTLKAQESLSAADRFSIGALSSIASIADLPSEISNLTNMGLNKIFGTNFRTDYKLLGDERVGEKVARDLARFDQTLADTDAAIAQKYNESSARLKSFFAGYGDQVRAAEIQAYERRGNFGPSLSDAQLRYQGSLTQMPNPNLALIEKVNRFPTEPATNLNAVDNSTNSSVVQNNNSSYVGGNNSSDQWSLYPN